MIRGVRRLLVVLAVGTVACATGCGGSSHGSTPTTASAATVVNATCGSSALRGKPPVQSCAVVLSDGERFSCGAAFKGATPTARQLERLGCRRLPSLKLSGAELALIARIDGARSCLTTKGVHAVGGPVLPTGPPGGTVQLPAPANSTQPGGEVVLDSSQPTFIAFYTNAAQAARIEPELARSDRSAHVLVEGHGAETIVWSHAPTEQLRDTVRACLPR
jgi:hypothetical protein